MTASSLWQRRVKRRAMLRAGVAGSGAVAALTALACGGSSTAPGEGGRTVAGISTVPAATQGEPKRGGTLIAAMPKEPTNYDPHLQVDSSKVGFLNLTSNGLFRLKTVGVTDFNSLEVEPDLLAAMPERPDPTTLVLKVRPGVAWHNLPPVNGRAFSGEDVKYNIERMGLARQTDGGANERAWIQAEVDAVQVVDPQTVQVKFKRPFPLWISFMATGYQKLVAPEVSSPTTQLIGTGPFTMTQHDRDAQAVFKRNPAYFKQGLPYIDEFIWRADPQQARRIAGLKTGDYAFGAANPTDIEEVKRANPRIVGHKYLGLSFPCWGFDTTVAELQDPRVRRATFMAVDWQGVVKALYDGDGYPLYHIPAGFTDFAAPLKDLPYSEYNVAKAKAMMEQAGYGPGKTLKVEIETNQAYPENIKMQPILQEQLREIFVEVTALPVVPPTEFLGRRNAPNQGWKIRMWSHASFGDPDEFLYGFYHTTGSRNYGKWGSPRLDALIEQQRGDVSAAERKKILLDIQKELDDKAYRQGVAQPQPYYLVQPWLKGFATLAAETGYQGLQVENSWIDRG
jgi:peptide/nickel transport system substrate-binding protein